MNEWRKAKHIEEMHRRCMRGAPLQVYGDNMIVSEATARRWLNDYRLYLNGAKRSQLHYIKGCYQYLTKYKTIDLWIIKIRYRL